MNQMDCLWKMHSTRSAIRPRTRRCWQWCSPAGRGKEEVDPLQELLVHRQDHENLLRLATHEMYAVATAGRKGTVPGSARSPAFPWRSVLALSAENQAIKGGTARNVRWGRHGLSTHTLPNKKIVPCVWTLETYHFIGDVLSRRVVLT